MGLGKTIQGVGVAEMLAREAGIRRVLVVCPASLKSQWRNEIHRFCDRDVQLVTGAAAERAAAIRQRLLFHRLQLRAGAARHPGHRARRLGPDHPRRRAADQELGIEDRHGSSRACRSPFALVLTGTPMENRLDELYSVVQFVDDRRLPPGFRFFHRHRVVDEKGKVLGYKNLDQLRENSAADPAPPHARSRSLQQLPPRTTRDRPHPADRRAIELHAGHMQIVHDDRPQDVHLRNGPAAAAKGPADVPHVGRQHVSGRRRTPGYSSKLEYLGELLDGLFAEPDRKAVLFSEWTTMLDLIEPMLAQRKLEYVRLDGSVPQKKRQAAGATGSRTTRAAACSSPPTPARRA